MRAPYFDHVAIQRPEDLGAGQWTLSKLTTITTLFGKNGSGKSRLLRAWRDQDNRRCHYIIPERIGALSFEPGYLNDETDGGRRSRSGQHNFTDSYRPRVVTRIQAYFMARGAVRGKALPGDPSELETLLSTALPDFELILKAANPPYELRRRSNGQPVGDVNQLSSGEAQIATLALDIVTVAAIWDLENESPRLLLIDEPDAHIHPDLQVRFADFLVRVAEKFELQIVVATHSTTLLAALGQFGDTAASVVYLDQSKASFEAKPFSKEIKEIAACLGGHALMGPLFGAPLLLVEGDDDYRIWSQVPRYHHVSFSVIPTNGDEIKNYQKSLETILGALREPHPQMPAGYALLDGDKSLPKPSVASPQQHVRFVGLQCHESENLYLTDDVLRLLNTNWVAARTQIAARANEFGQKAAFLSTAENWDRKTVDIHDFIDQITQILDPKNVHWTLRVARALGSGRPSGQLLDFLGNALVDALWGKALAT
jgi:energy-coupling factor transporter ATP-binding protein EcfA2